MAEKAIATDDTDKDSLFLDDKERHALRQMLDEVQKDSSLRGLVLDEHEALKYVRARKNDALRSVQLLRSHMSHREKYGMDQLMPEKGPLQRELMSQKFTVLESRDSSSAQLLLFTMRRHDSARTDNTAAMQAVVLQLDVAMRSTETQKSGVVLLVDMQGATFSNFDRKLSYRLLNLLQDGYPARLKMVYVIDAPWWLRTAMAVILPFLKKKTQQRITLASRSDIFLRISKESLPKQLGGMLDHNHTTWIKSCIKHNQEQRDGQAFRNPRKVSDPLLTLDSHPVDNVVQSNVAQSHTVVHPAVTTPVRDDVSSQSQSLRTESSPSEDEKSSSEAVTPSSFLPSLTDDSIQAHRVAGSPLVNETSSEVVTESAMSTPSSSDLPPEPPQRSSSASQRSPDKPPKRQHGVPEEDALTPPVPNKPDKDWPESPPLPPKDLDVYSDEDHSISIESLEASFRERGREGVYSEYAMLRLEKSTGNFDTSSHPANVSKNRYADVLCLEHSRVKLALLDEDEFSDYINANFVDSFKQKKAYIFTQGPLRNTYADFWRMVWEQRTQIIVMTTKLWERGRMKCGQYWPEVDGTAQYGDVVITSTGETVRQDYTVRQFHVIKGDDSRSVTQYQFTGWPDFGVPPSAQSFLQFLDDIRNVHDENSKHLAQDERRPPIVMHCSAGIGRTGTLGAIDIGLQQLDATGKVNVEGIVRKMRCQRAFSIQTPEQYEFCFKAIIEASKISKPNDQDLQGN